MASPYYFVTERTIINPKTKEQKTDYLLLDKEGFEERGIWTAYNSLAEISKVVYRMLVLGQRQEVMLTTSENATEQSKKLEKAPTFLNYPVLKASLDEITIQGPLGQTSALREIANNLSELLAQRAKANEKLEKIASH